MVFIHNGSTGGTDIVAAVASKVSNVSVGRAMVYFDLSIISSSVLLKFVFIPDFEFAEAVPALVYGLVTLFIIPFVTDMIINTNRMAVQFTIFSRKWEEIATAINNEAHRGCTVLSGMGWYSKKEVKSASGDVPQNRICHYFPNYKVNRQGRPHIAGAGQRRLRQRLRRTETEDAPPGPDRHTSCPPRGLVENRMIATPT